VLTACFFCRTNDPGILERVDFYAQDLRILKDLGFDVRVATRPSELVPANLYFVWWWTWAFLPIMYARLRRKPVIVTGTFDYWKFAERPAWHRALQRYALRAADANVFVSELERSSVSEALATRNAQYVPHGVDTSIFVPPPADAVREPFILTIAGSGMDHQNSTRKCIAEIIRAAPLIRRQHPETRFVIVGKKGTDFPMLCELAHDVGAGSYIDFPGIIDDSEKLRLLQTCRAYLQPSRYEGFGLSILEAMSCGAPVITTAVGAVPEVGGDAVRYSLDSSPESIAEATSAVLSDLGAQRALARAARQRAVSCFPIERRRHELEKVVLEVLAT